jgi:hypothetical protein
MGYTTRERYDGMYTEVKRVVPGPDGEPLVKQTTCCCAKAGATRQQCRDASGNKNPCRCWCHCRKPVMRSVAN